MENLPHPWPKLLESIEGPLLNGQQLLVLSRREAGHSCSGVD